MNVKEAFEVLELKLDANLQQIKTRYYRKARETHPDRVGSSFNEAFARLREAYDIAREFVQEREETCPTCGGEGYFIRRSKNFGSLKVRCGKCRASGKISG